MPLSKDFSLSPTYELRSILMSYGPDVEALSPQTLRDEMADLYRLGAEYYAS